MKVLYAFQTCQNITFHQQKILWNYFDHFLFQTLNSISAEKNSTIIFPLPIDFLTHFMGKKGGGSESGGGNRRGNRKTSTSRGDGGSNGNKSDCSSDGSIRHKED